MYALLILLFISLVSADSIYNNQINFEPGTSRTHTQTIYLNLSQEIIVVVGNEFSVSSGDYNTDVSGTLTWTNTSFASYAITSPSNCTQGESYEHPVTIGGTYYDDFTYVCVYDNDIVNYKLEYGHGSFNYLDNSYPYLGNESMSLFNLIRVFEPGTYLDPDEDGMNGSINCTFPEYLVLSAQDNLYTEITHNANDIDAAFFWEELFGIFRVAPLEQEVQNVNVGDFYNITCTDLTIQYTTGQIKADFSDVSWEIRDIRPLNITTVEDDANDLITYTILNYEKYPIYDVEFMWTDLQNDAVFYNDIEELRPGEALRFDVAVDTEGNLTLDTTFVPSWQHESRVPQRYAQFDLHEYCVHSLCDVVTTNVTPTGGGDGPGPQQRGTFAITGQAVQTIVLSDDERGQAFNIILMFVYFWVMLMLYIGFLNTRILWQKGSLMTLMVISTLVFINNFGLTREIFGIDQVLTLGAGRDFALQLSFTTLHTLIILLVVFVAALVIKIWRQNRAPIASITRDI